MSAPSLKAAPSRARLTGLYAAFAALSIAVNLGSQWMINIVARGEVGVIVSLVIGTLAGVLVKYSLDKRYIFRYRTGSAVQEVRTFVVYALVSGVTTIIFWGFELGFGAAFQSAAARYLGGGIGLVIGYIVKYALDKKYTFAGDPRIPAVEVDGQR